MSGLDFMDGLGDEFNRLFKSSYSSSASRGFKRFGTDDFTFNADPEPFKKQTPQDPAIQQEIKVSLEELFTGTVKKLKIQRQIITPSGFDREEKVLQIEVKPGWKAGTKITFPHHGDQKHGILAADIIFIIQDKPHQYFKRDSDNNLLFTAKVPLREALVGCLIQIPTIEGSIIPVQLNEVIQPGTQRRIPGQGLPDPKCPGRRADLIVVFDVEFPTNLTTEQKTFLATHF